MKRTILIVLAALGLTIFTYTLLTDEASASSTTLYTLHVYGPKNAGGCYSGPQSSNFKMNSSHIAFDLPAGTYTVCVEGGGQEVVVLPSSDQSANCDYNSNQMCPCSN